MVPRGLEPRTLRLLAVRSNQLSYETCWHEFYSLQIKKHSIIIHVFNAECFPLVCNAGVYLVVLIKFEKCLKARLAQSAERKALNLVVVGSSPTVGVVHGPPVGGNLFAQLCAIIISLPGRLELPTLRLTASRSNQLSYGSRRKV